MFDCYLAVWPLGLVGCLPSLLFLGRSEKVHVFGHEDVAVELEAVSCAKRFEPVLEPRVGGVGVQAGKASIATEGEEVQVAFVLIPKQAERHGSS